MGELPDPDPHTPATPTAVLEFWFETLAPRDWFRTRPALDRRIAHRFGPTLGAAMQCELWHWRTCDAGRLAEIIVLDQFSRNVFRDDRRAFLNDALALALAQEAVARGVDTQLPPSRRAFLYMPYMHSESMAIHEQALQLFDQAGLEDQLEHERRHHRVLKRFGRYPSRNRALGRTNTSDEAEFLQTQGSGF